jgi:hypothetical protein
MANQVIALRRFLNNLVDGPDDFMKLEGARDAIFAALMELAPGTVAETQDLSTNVKLKGVVTQFQIWADRLNQNEVLTSEQQGAFGRLQSTVEGYRKVSVRSVEKPGKESASAEQD